MVTVSGPWTSEEMSQFLSAETVPLRLGCRTPAGRPWMLSLWYRFVDGTFECATGADAAVVDYLDYDDDVSFEVSTNEPPYCGVRGNGTATMTADDDKTVLTDLLHRYLGGTDSPLAERLLAPDRREIQITITPDRLHTWDYSNRM
ncbi:pyridoxamine 5'-phosphate oxidase [Haloarcula taiwanensis]|uniref:Pyridoxamine 5'-phosphate oxidase n=1 Tax=Haloarcula taiwanensis TaxID=1932004 RepID=A0A2H4ZZM8_9EURY|nr:MULTISPECIES: pyridoxamine 5'-phosphate oxidase [Haloarcula]AUG47942.1 pyridoxamine 5'-phosphate oxidase [Haloarcula taiwanensis]RLM39298.1 pyridoxamine 5'-phosphate oxidase family protein [Haloarcula sp. Atlit-120R]RLM47197.1 pyridoxamine 5'-phosphate oxidase family protein [Haloarcula sp. Atlit-47R]